MSSVFTITINTNIEKSFCVMILNAEQKKKKKNDIGQQTKHTTHQQEEIIHNPKLSDTSATRPFVFMSTPNEKLSRQVNFAQNLAGGMQPRILPNVETRIVQIVMAHKRPLLMYLRSVF